MDREQFAGRSTRPQDPIQPVVEAHRKVDAQFDAARMVIIRIKRIADFHPKSELTSSGEGVCLGAMAKYPKLGAVLWRIALLALLLATFGCEARQDALSQPPSTNGAPRQSAEQARHVRQPAVAGLFYPADEKVLARTVDLLLANAPAHSIGRLRGLVCPHAGYEFSGPTAAIAYKTLAGREIQTAIVLGPSHYAWFEGASIPQAEAYRTPLGLVPISEKAKSLAARAPFALESPCRVQRPAWWNQRPTPPPEPGQDTAETWEHSVEVQVPFLQRVLKNFKLLPVVVGNADPARIAAGLADLLDDKTIVVASSDLSHYYTYEKAQALDKRCVQAICDLNITEMETQEACGKLPVLSLMHLAKLKGWKAQLLDYRNSGDTAGRKDNVVGYSAIAFYEPPLGAAPGGGQSSPPPQGASGKPSQGSLGEAERKLLLALARRTVASVATNGSLPEVASKDLPPRLAEPKGCFVTLTEGGDLRGCIGHLIALEPLYQAVIDNARNAAVRDTRFRPVQSGEVARIKIEISVLTDPQPLAFSSPEDLLAKLHPHEDGVVLRIGPRSATFLPQVWEQIPGKEDFLGHLSAKAGCPASAWRGKETSVSIYHVECFQEN